MVSGKLIVDVEAQSYLDAADYVLQMHGSLASKEADCDSARYVLPTVSAHTLTACQAGAQASFDTCLDRPFECLLRDMKSMQLPNGHRGALVLLAA